MTVQRKALRWNEHGEPILTITAVGVHDVYRLSNHMLKGQVEFCDIGARAIQGLKRKLSKDQWDWLMRFMHGDGGFR